MIDTATTGALSALLVTAAATADGDVLARAVQEGPLRCLACERVAIYAADKDGATLRMVGHSGGDEVRALYGNLPVDDTTPNAVVFRTGEELFLSLDETAEQYPLLATAAALYDGAKDVEVAFVPLRHAGRPVGVMGLLLRTAVPRTWETRATLDAVAAVVGLWCAAHRLDLRPQRHIGVLALSPRQREILRLAGDGLTNGQIAAQLGFAESTVKSDLTHIYRLTGALSRQELLDRTSDLT